MDLPCDLEQKVSVDFNRTSHSCIFAPNETKVVGGRTVRVRRGMIMNGLFLLYGRSGRGDGAAVEISGAGIGASSLLGSGKSDRRGVFSGSFCQRRRRFCLPRAQTSEFCSSIGLLASLNLRFPIAFGSIMAPDRRSPNRRCGTMMSGVTAAKAAIRASALAKGRNLPRRHQPDEQDVALRPNMLCHLWVRCKNGQRQSVFDVMLFFDASCH